MYVSPKNNETTTQRCLEQAMSQSKLFFEKACKTDSDYCLGETMTDSQLKLFMTYYDEANALCASK